VTDDQPPTLPAFANSVPDLIEALRSVGYIADRGLATAIYLSLRLGRPLLLEGEAGVGKTAVAQALTELFAVPLIRLQCYEGIDAHQSLYEWDHARQLIHIRVAEAAGQHDEMAIEHDLFTERFLSRRALLRALDDREGQRVLLIDELDRADDEFEAFLLEFLAEFAVTIPELGTVRAERPPVVIITSNRVRELHDALKRRCLYHWIEHPTFERALEILELRVPGVPEGMARQIAGTVYQLQQMELYKRPGIAEMIDWAEAMLALGVRQMDAEVAADSIGAVLKYYEDQQRVRDRLAELIATEPGGRA